MSHIDIEPPEVPMERKSPPPAVPVNPISSELPKKKGFLKRLFGKKDPEPEGFPFHTEEELSQLDSELKTLETTFSTNPFPEEDVQKLEDSAGDIPPEFIPPPIENLEFDPFAKQPQEKDSTMQLPPDFAPEAIEDRKVKKEKKEKGKKKSGNKQKKQPGPEQDWISPIPKIQPPPEQESQPRPEEVPVPSYPSYEDMDMQKQPEDGGWNFPGLENQSPPAEEQQGQPQQQQGQQESSMAVPGTEQDWSRPQETEEQNAQAPAEEMQAAPVPEATSTPEERGPRQESATAVSAQTVSPEREIDKRDTVPDIDMERIRKKLHQAFDDIDHAADEIDDEIKLIVKGEHRGAPKSLNASDTLKRLLADMKKLDRQKFHRYKIKNKEDFAEMVRGMALKQHHLEQVRSEILHHLINKLLKENEMKIDYKITELKKHLTEKLVKDEQQLRLIEQKTPEYKKAIAQMKQEQGTLAQIKKNIKIVVEDRIKDELPKRVAKEKAALQKEKDATERIKIQVATQEQKMIAKQEALEKARRQLEQKKADLDKGYSEKRLNLDEQHKSKLQELAKQRKEFEVEKRRAMAILTKAGAVHNEMLDIEKKKSELRSEEKDFEERKKEWEIEVDAQQKLYEDEEISIQQLETGLKKAKKGLDNERRRMDRMEYDKYIEDQLKGIKPSSRLDTPSILQSRKSDHPIYRKISQCKAAIKGKDFGRAKQLYNELKTEFYQAHLSQDEKSEVYTTIRGLYTEINLGILNS